MADLADLTSLEPVVINTNVNDDTYEGSVLSYSSQQPTFNLAAEMNSIYLSNNQIVIRPTSSVNQSNNHPSNQSENNSVGQSPVSNDTLTSDEMLDLEPPYDPRKPEDARRIRQLNDQREVAEILRSYPAIDERMTLAEILKIRIPRTWEAVFEDAKQNLALISRRLEIDQEFYPRKHDLFKALELCPLHRVKLVMIGQDPYPQLASNGINPKAVGLSFSIARDDEEIPGSLSNIYKELEATVTGFKRPSHGDLTRWALQGVLLLNKSLTVKPGQPKADNNLWMPLITKIIRAISEAHPKTVYLLLGRPAQSLLPIIGERNVSVCGVHPSPNSAHQGFFGAKLFIKTNNELRKLGKEPIDWNLD